MVDWLAIVIEEYKSISEERLTALQTHQSTLGFGTAILGFLFVTGLNLWDKFLLPEFLFLFFTPAIIYLIIIVWVGELKRLVRACIFLAMIEEKVNKELINKPKALSWQSWVRIKQDGNVENLIIGNYRAIACIFLLISLSSIILGIYKISLIFSFKFIVAISLLEISILIGVFGWYVNEEKDLIRRLLN